MKFRSLAFVLSLSSISLFSQSPHKVAIIGGGMSGISAAYHIHEIDPQASITIFEKEKLLGGNAKTILTTNAKKEPVQVDAGPQYFTEGPWDEYLKFLKANGVYDERKTSEFVGSISIQNEGSKRPILITPLKGSFRGEKLGKLLNLKKFFDISHSVYNNPNSKHQKAIGSWVRDLDMNLEFKQQVVLPFLAASLGTTISEIKQTSTADIVKLFAFRKPSSKSTYKVMHEGMGTLIQRIGKNLEEQHVQIRCESPVKGLDMQADGKALVSYSHADVTKDEAFDFVVIAVHADQAAKLVKEDIELSLVYSVLKEFEYFKARIVLHSDPTLVNKERPAFLNVLTTIDNQIAANTMNLGMVDERYEGIYKSWLTEELALKLKLNGKFIHEEIFWHPLITPQFNQSLLKLNKLTDGIKGLCFGGGWTQGLETQETAVVSGIKAAEKYRRFTVNE
jgi:predicted NAD/FAD-binding protein